MEAKISDKWLQAVKNIRFLHGMTGVRQRVKLKCFQQLNIGWSQLDDHGEIVHETVNFFLELTGNLKLRGWE